MNNSPTRCIDPVDELKEFAKWCERTRQNE